MWSHKLRYRVVSFRNNGLTTLLYVTALPVHIERCYNVSLLGQESVPTLQRCSSKINQGGYTLNSSVKLTTRVYSSLKLTNDDRVTITFATKKVATTRQLCKRRDGHSVTERLHSPYRYNTVHSDVNDEF